MLNKKLYRQIYGVVMGSSQGPMFANIFLDTVENEGRYPNRLGYYCRYIDDKLTVRDYSINKQ